MSLLSPSKRSPAVWAPKYGGLLLVLLTYCSPHDCEDICPVCCWVSLPVEQSVQLAAFIPELYVFTGHNSHVLSLSGFKYDPLGQTTM